NIGRNTIVLMGKQLAGATDSGLYLIEDQQCLMLITKTACRLKISLLCWQNSAFTLNRLQNYRAGFIANCSFQRCNIIVWYMGNPLGTRAKAFRVLGLPTNIYSKHRAPMKTVQRRNNFVFGLAKTLAGNLARQLECRFICLC